jgi:hypothetical protein
MLFAPDSVYRILKNDCEAILKLKLNYRHPCLSVIGQNLQSKYH